MDQQTFLNIKTSPKERHLNRKSTSSQNIRKSKTHQTNIKKTSNNHQRTSTSKQHQKTIKTHQTTSTKTSNNNKIPRNNILEWIKQTPHTQKRLKSPGRDRQSQRGGEQGDGSWRRLRALISKDFISNFLWM